MVVMLIVSFRPFPIGEILYCVEEGVFSIFSEEIKVTEVSLTTIFWSNMLLCKQTSPIKMVNVLACLCNCRSHLQLPF